jgi:hypothetical protein
MGAWLQLTIARRDGSVPFKVWLGARLVAVLVGAFLVFTLWHMQPPEASSEPPVIKAVRLAEIETVRPKPIVLPPPIPQQKPQETAPQSAVAKPALPTPPTQNQSPALSDRPTPSVLPRVFPQNSPANTAPTLPRIAGGPANAPPAQSSGSASQGQIGGTPKLGNSSLAVIRARECARLDPRDRPPDCPPNDELRRLLANERGPKYRPENADAFSRNELAWRGVPPPCLDDGENAALKGTKLCVRFGNTPSRVRSPREICLARGLGGCEAVPDQRDVDAAVAQAKALKP